MKILVPVDFHETSYAAFIYALKFAEHFEADITLLHVIQSVVYAGDAVMYDTSPILLEAGVNNLKAFHEEVSINRGITLLPSVRVVREVIFGVPGSSIVQYADDNDFDVIVLGTRDNHGFFDKLLGSTSSAVIRFAKRTVIVVHKDSEIKLPERVVFGIPDDVSILHALSQFNLINDVLNANTHFVHFNLSGKDSIEYQKEELIKQLFEINNAPYSFEIKEFGGNDLDNSFVEYCKIQQIDMLALVHREEGFFESLIGNSESVRLAQNFKIPVMILQE